MSPKRPIADHGRDAAHKKLSSTHNKIGEAQRKIIAEIEKNGGVYAYAGGRLSSAEVLRRAGLDRGVLQKPRHIELRKSVKQWVTKLKLELATGKSVVRESVTRRAENAEDKADFIYQQWAEAELEYVEQARHLVELEEKLSVLAKENEELRQELSRRR